MSGQFDFQIPRQRPEWWIVQQADIIKGLALLCYGQLNGEDPKEEFVCVEHLLVAEDYRRKGVGTLILKTAQKLAQKRCHVAGVFLDSEPELLSYYARLGFVRREYQPGGAFVKLIWRA